jgi:hypothetical protein
MPAKQKKSKELTKTKDIQPDKISVFFRRSILKSIMKILLMEHGGFRTFKSVKNINRLFSNMDMQKYKDKPELMSYIWCICYVSKQWLDGVVTPEIIAELAKSRPDYDNIKGDIITSCMNDTNIISAPEAKAIFDLIAEALQFGYISAMKDEYINLIEDIDMNEPGSFRKLTERLFQISQSLVDIRHQTNMIQNKISFNTGDMDSIKESLTQTISSLCGSGSILKTGIKRWNTLLSPGYMNGKLYVYAGTPASFKSGILLKSALDIRKYNPGYPTKTPGMRPCVVYVTMENSFTETIERIWNMTFDDPITNYGPEEAIDMLCKELGITKLIADSSSDEAVPQPKSELAALLTGDNEEKKVPNIEVVIKYFSYREISTDDLYTIISDLRDEGMECVAFIHDYIKRIRPSVPTPDNEKLELNHVLNEEKALAVAEDIPFITAHQLNRAAASIIDNAARQGKGDLSKLVGREHIGTAWEVTEISDWLGTTNITYKPGTDQRYLEIDVVKRRRIDSSDYKMAQFTHLAHPFAPNNGLRLLDDLYLDKVLSVRSLDTDIDINGNIKEKTNAVPRLKTITQEQFTEYD